MTKRNVAPAAGLVIRMSKGKVLGFLAILVVALGAGITLIAAWWMDTPVPLPVIGRSSQHWSWLTGLLLAVFAMLFIPMGILYLFSREMLILADEQLQLVQNNKVVAQIPYRNIVRLAVASREGVEFLGIELANTTDPDTFADTWDFERSKTDDGWHFLLYASYERDLGDICKTLDENVARSRPA